MRQRHVESADSNTRRAGISKRFRYHFDNALAKGLRPMILLLAFTTLVVVLIAGFILWFADVDLNGERARGIEGVWASLLRTLDPGTMGSDRGWLFRVTSLLVTLSGIFIVSTLIGLLANGMSQRIDELRRGRSEVIESGHTLLLGWSPKVFLIVREIADSAGPKERPCVVVLAERDMVEMEERFRQAFGDSTKVRLVTRSGNPTSPFDLGRVAPHQARSIVVLRDPTHGDAAAVRSILALDHLGLSSTTTVVIELDDLQRADALTSASSLNIVPVVSDEWIASITARAVYAPTLTDIYEDLLNFEGAEVYFREIHASMNGRTMREVCQAVEGGAPFGVRSKGRLNIAPPPDFQLATGDELVVIADQHDTVNMSGAWRPSTAVVEVVDGVEGIETAAADGRPAHLLILGWSDLGTRVLPLLDQSLPDGSIIDVVAPPDWTSTLPKRKFEQFELRYTEGLITDPRSIRQAIGKGDISRVLVLSNRRTAESAHHDADALLAVLELRQLLGKDSGVQVTVEIADPENVDLVRRGAQEEFIVGERLVGLLMSQVSQTPGVMDVLRSLVTEDDTDLRLLPAAMVLDGRSTMGGVEAAERLRRSGHYLIGAGVKGEMRLHPELQRLEITPGMKVVTVSRVIKPATPRKAAAEDSAQ